MSNKLKLEVGKFYTTRDGRKVRAICVDRRHPVYPVIVLSPIPDSSDEVTVAYTADGAFMYESPNTQDIVGPWVEKPTDWDWANVPPWTPYIAMDSDYEWYAYETEPELESHMWGTYGEYVKIPDEYAPKFEGDWRESLLVRPGHD